MILFIWLSVLLIYLYELRTEIQGLSSILKSMHNRCHCGEIQGQIQWFLSETVLRLSLSIVWPVGCLIDSVFISSSWLIAVVGIWVREGEQVYLVI